MPMVSFYIGDDLADALLEVAAVPLLADWTALQPVGDSVSALPPPTPPPPPLPPAASVADPDMAPSRALLRAALLPADTAPPPPCNAWRLASAVPVEAPPPPARFGEWSAHGTAARPPPPAPHLTAGRCLAGADPLPPHLRETPCTPPPPMAIARMNTGDPKPLLYPPSAPLRGWSLGWSPMAAGVLPPATIAAYDMWEPEVFQPPAPPARIEAIRVSSPDDDAWDTGETLPSTPTTGALAPVTGCPAARGLQSWATSGLAAAVDPWDEPPSMPAASRSAVAPAQGSALQAPSLYEDAWDTGETTTSTPTGSGSSSPSFSAVAAWTPSVARGRATDPYASWDPWAA